MRSLYSFDRGEMDPQMVGEALSLFGLFHFNRGKEPKQSLSALSCSTIYQTSVHEASRPRSFVFIFKNLPKEGQCGS